MGDRGGEGGSMLPIIGGVVVSAGIAALIYLLMTRKQDEPQKIQPPPKERSVRRLPCPPRAPEPPCPTRSNQKRWYDDFIS